MSYPSRPYRGRSALLAATLVLMAAEATAQFQGGGRGGGGSQERPSSRSSTPTRTGASNTAERQAAREMLQRRCAADAVAAAAVAAGRRPVPGSRSRQPTCASIRMRRSTTRRRSARSSSSSRIRSGRPSWWPSTTPTSTCRRRVTVDGRVYRDVGVHFRGNSSFGVGNGYKRSLNLTFDFVHEDQAIGGYRTLNFLNANADPTLMRTVLSMHIARQYIAAPKANFVRVVINGENWGVYANAQQFNKEFVERQLQDHEGRALEDSAGGRRRRRRFHYQGDDASRYSRTFQIKSKDEPEAWTALIDLAKTLQETPAEQLEAALASRARHRRLPALPRARQRHGQRRRLLQRARRTTRSIAIPTAGSTSSFTMRTRCSAPAADGGGGGCS